MSYEKSFYTKIGSTAKNILGIRDISLFKKKLHKQIGKLIYHKKYTSKDIVRMMQEMGMKEGSFVCIHSSMKEFYNFRGTAEELIEEMISVLGSEGTLMMPAFPDKKLIHKEGYVFDPMNDRTGAGYLAETFRKYPNVKRSINIQHSACAIGKYADYLTKDHQFSKDCWDEYSPWRRSLELGVLVFNFGLPRSYMGTFHHCVESKLQSEYPYYSQFFTSLECFRYYGKDGHIYEYLNKVSRLDRRTRKKKVTKYFTSEDWCIKKISNLEIKVFYTAHCFPKMLELGRKGICVYYVPSPKKYEFERNKNV